MKILHIGKELHWFTQSFIEKINKLGYEINFFDTSVSKMISKFTNNEKYNIFQNEKIIKRFQKMIKIKFTNYDIIFILGADDNLKSFYKFVREVYPDSQIINFNWLPLSYRDYRESTIFFNKTYSFDYKDSLENECIIYHPLFFTDLYRVTKSPKERLYHITFIGSLASQGRFEIIEKLYQWSIDNKINIFLYLYIPYHKYILLKLHHPKAEIFKFCHFSPLSHTKIANIFKQSKCVFDILPINQTGHTMRTFEAMGADCKLVTNNFRLRGEKFVNEKNTFFYNKILDIDPLFVKEYYNNNYNDIDQFTFDNWINNVLFEEELSVGK